MGNNDQDNLIHETPLNTQHSSSNHPMSSMRARMDINNPVMSVQEIQQQYKHLTTESPLEQLRKNNESTKPQNLLYSNTPSNIQTCNKYTTSIPSHNFEPIYSENEINDKDYYSYPELNQNALNPNQFIVPANLPTYIIGNNPITEIELFT